MSLYSSPKTPQATTSNTATESFAAHLHSIVEIISVENSSPYSSLIRTTLYNYQDGEYPNEHFPYRLRIEPLDCLLSIPHQSTSLEPCQPNKDRVIQVFGSFGDFGLDKDGLRASIIKWTE